MGNTLVPDQGGAESGAHLSVEESRLLAVVEAGAKLLEAVQAGIVAMFEAAKK